MENLRKRINVKLASNENILKKHGAKANYIASKQFDEHLFALFIRQRPQIILEKKLEKKNPPH